MTRTLWLLLLAAAGSRLVPALLDALPAVGAGIAMGATLVACGGVLALDSLRGPRP